MKLKGKQAYSPLLKSRPTCRTTCFFLYQRPSDERICSFGVLVPKLQVPLAVDRNRIKRVVREFFRLYQKKIPSGIYLVRWVLPKKGLKNVSSKYLIRGLALNRELLVLFESINQSQSSESAHV